MITQTHQLLAFFVCSGVVGVVVSLGFSVVGSSVVGVVSPLTISSTVLPSAKSCAASAFNSSMDTITLSSVISEAVAIISHKYHHHLSQ